MRWTLTVSPSSIHVTMTDPQFVAARTSGQIINTCGWVDGEGYNLLVSSIRAFRADVVIVLSDERLSSMLESEVGAVCKVVRIQKSGGVRPFKTQSREPFPV